jgi:hypothetical protein
MLLRVAEISVEWFVGNCNQTKELANLSVNCSFVGFDPPPKKVNWHNYVYAFSILEKYRDIYV